MLVLPFRIQLPVAVNPFIPSEHHVSRPTGNYPRVSLHRVQSGPEPAVGYESGWLWRHRAVGEWRATVGSRWLAAGLALSSSTLCSGSSSRSGESVGSGGQTGFSELEVLTPGVRFGVVGCTERLCEMKRKLQVRPTFSNLLKTNRLVS